MKDIILNCLKALYKKLFWKNKNFTYINSNKKIVNIQEIPSNANKNGTKIVNCQSKKTTTLSQLKNHFIKMKIEHWVIDKNLQNNENFSYIGFPSQMFSIYDGFTINDTCTPTFIELSPTTNKYYSIQPVIKKQNKSIDINIPNNEEISLIIESSYKINLTKIKNVPYYLYKINEPPKINNNYLNKIYNFVRSFLDKCTQKNIKRVNLYITTKTSASFIVGRAIQTCHPKICIYEYMNNEFKFYLDLQSKKIMEAQ